MGGRRDFRTSYRENLSRTVLVSTWITSVLCLFNLRKLADNHDLMSSKQSVRKEVRRVKLGLVDKAGCHQHRNENTKIEYQKWIPKFLKMLPQGKR